MELQFTKMHGLGNDFVVIDATSRPVELSAAQLRLLADRHFGIGCDQVLLVGAPDAADADFSYRIFNADGGEVEQCGNGARCFARFVKDKSLTEKDFIRVSTKSGIIVLKLEKDGQVTVDMGVPDFSPENIPFEAKTQSSSYNLDIDGQVVALSVLSIGNPHAVMLVDDCRHAAVATLGPKIEHHPRFPERVNVGFMEIVDPHEINLRVYERGSGETLACGTGACAAAVTGKRLGRLADRVKVNLRGGSLVIDWPGEGRPVTMTGPATTVYEGRIKL